MSVAGKALVVVGGAVVTAGLIWWWLKKHPPTPPPPECSDFFTESECLDAGCYWYWGSCHSTPEHPPDTHYACVVDQQLGLILCSLVDGAGTDQCDPYAPREFCWDKVPCASDSECGSGAKCWEHHCYHHANEYLDWEGTQQESILFLFDERVVGNKLLGGNITFTLAPWKWECTPHVKIYLIRDGERVTCVFDKYFSPIGPTGWESHTRTDPLDVVYFAAEAADGIEIWCMCEWAFAPEPILTKFHSQFVYL